MRVTWAVEQEGTAEWRIGMGILYSEVCDHFLQLLVLLKVWIFTGLGLFPSQPPIHGLIEIWKFFSLWKCFHLSITSVSSIFYRSKENVIIGIIIVTSQSMHSTFSVVLCWDQNDSVHDASNEQLCKKQKTSWLTLNTVIKLMPKKTSHSCILF